MIFRSTISLCVSTVLLCTYAVAAEKPNLLWITSEDNNVQWVGCYGHPNADTPRIDQLAQEGFRYTHCFATTPGLRGHSEALGLPESMPFRWALSQCVAAIGFRTKKFPTLQMHFVARDTIASIIIKPITTLAVAMTKTAGILPH